MGLQNKSVCELPPSAACDLYGPRRQAVDSRTRLKQYFLDPVLPMLTLLSMSVLTVVMLVVIVATVADMDSQLPGGYVMIDPWTGVSPASPGGFNQDRVVYADLAPSLDPAEELEPWPGSPVNDPF
jgi:hypothetical protein